MGAGHRRPGDIRDGPGGTAHGGDAVECLCRLPRHQRRQRRPDDAQPGQPVQGVHRSRHEEIQERRAPFTIMGRLAKGYSDAEIAAMAEFFSKQKLHVTNQASIRPRSRRAPASQESNCGRCHIEDGKEGKDDTPVMASQWLPYMQMQMADYLSGKRKMPEKMKEKVDPMSKEDLDALLHFYASVK
jgi:cytochrome c553